MKVLGLDIGDVWVGSAISDSLKITCKPLKTVRSENLLAFLQDILQREEITTVVIGYPKTLRGTISEQTKKVISLKEKLETTLSTINGKTISWVLWDERLSSKRAQALHSKKKPSKEEKLMEHSRAAAFILQSYLDHQALF